MFNAGNVSPESQEVLGHTSSNIPKRTINLVENPYCNTFVQLVPVVLLSVVMTEVVSKVLERLIVVVAPEEVMDDEQELTFSASVHLDKVGLYTSPSSHSY